MPDDVTAMAREIMAAAYEDIGNTAAAFTLRNVGAVGIKMQFELGLVQAAILATIERCAAVAEGNYLPWQQTGDPVASGHQDAAMAIRSIGAGWI